MLITFSKFAEIKGVSRAAVTLAIKSGRIEGAVKSLNGKKMLDDKMALELWDLNTTAPKHLQKAKQLEQVKQMSDDDIPLLNVSRARREHYDAELARIKMDQQLKDLVPADVVKKESFALGRSVRESLANLADRLSNELAGESDPSRIHQMLMQEHRQCLIELCDA
tara:strand:- start:923 stop:1420 length:498 start_codon:yes stop_codon:yes gene_type:complete